MTSASGTPPGVLLGGLAMFGPFSIDTIFPAFRAIGGEFGADKLAMRADHHRLSARIRDVDRRW